MLDQDPSITEYSFSSGGNILVSGKSCGELESIYSDLQFMLQYTQITIKPSGYLFNLPGQDDCFIGIQSIPDSFNQFRLGTIFLRNFYAGLDYEKNFIMIGLNVNGDSASLHTKKSGH